MSDATRQGCDDPATGRTDYVFDCSVLYCPAQLSLTNGINGISAISVGFPPPRQEPDKWHEC